jgi:F-type H+-transporting ATPase subunit b
MNEHSTSTAVSAKPSGLVVLVRTLIGIAIAIGGTWLSVNWHPAFQTAVQEQGIPLNIGTTIAVIGVFIAWFPVIKFFFIAPLAEAIEGRNAELERTFAEAENLRADMTRMKEEYEQRIAQTEASAREQIQAQIKEAQQLRQQLMAEAAAQAEELKKAAQEEIARETERVVADLRVKVVDMTLLATEHLIGNNLDDERNRKLVEDFISRVEAPSA